MEVEIRTVIDRTSPLSAIEPGQTSNAFSPDSTDQAPAYVRLPSSTEEPGVELGHSEGVLGAKCLPKARRCHLLLIRDYTGYLVSSAYGLP